MCVGGVRQKEGKEEVGWKKKKFFYFSITWRLKAVAFRNIKDVTLHCAPLIFLSENQSAVDQCRSKFFIWRLKPIYHISCLFNHDFICSLLTDEY